MRYGRCDIARWLVEDNHFTPDPVQELRWACMIGGVYYLRVLIEGNCGAGIGVKHIVAVLRAWSGMYTQDGGRAGRYLVRHVRAAAGAKK